MTLADQLPELPPPSDRVGVPGHDDATVVANAIRILTHRANGLTYDQIANEMGYADRSGVRRALLASLARHEAEAVGELRVIENMRYDADERALRAIITNTESTPEQTIAAINARGRVSAGRRALNGLDAPKKVELSSGMPEAVSAALAKLRTSLFDGDAYTVTDLPADDDGD